MTQAHKIVAETAKALAGTMYEELMRNDALFRAWREQNPKLHGDALGRKWIAQAWPGLIPAARATLAHMLQGNLPELLKNQISDALIKDNVFTAARRAKCRKTLDELVGINQLLVRPGRMALRR